MEKAEQEIGMSKFTHFRKPLHHFNDVVQTSVPERTHPLLARQVECLMRCFDTSQRSNRPRHHRLRTRAIGTQGATPQVTWHFY